MKTKIVVYQRLSKTTPKIQKEVEKLHKSIKNSSLKTLIMLVDEEGNYNGFSKNDNVERIFTDYIGVN